MENPLDVALKEKLEEPLHRIKMVLECFVKTEIDDLCARQLIDQIVTDVGFWRTPKGLRAIMQEACEKRDAFMDTST